MKTKKDCRLILDMHKLDIHVFEEFGRYNYSNAQSVLPLHVHDDAIEICYLSRGNQTYLVGDDVYQVRGGECFITYPNEIHGTGNLPEEKGVLCSDRAHHRLQSPRWAWRGWACASLQR